VSAPDEAAKEINQVNENIIHVSEHSASVLEKLK